MNTPTTMTSDYVLQALDGDIRHYSKKAHNNYGVAYWLIGLSILASLVAAFLGVGEANKWLTAVVAAFPGIAALANSTLNFEQRSRICWKHVRCCERLHGRLMNGEPPVHIWNELISCREAVDQEWPSFGTLPAKPKAPAQQ